MGEKVLMKGNEAIAEAAIRAGCLHYFGYPITPQTEIAAYMAKRMPKVGGVFLQAESEIAAINMVLGVAAAGKRVMTSSSSPGVSLKSEGMSYISGSDVPALVVNVQRGGPGLGGIQPSQSDYFQAVKGGSHGDFKKIVLAPASKGDMAFIMHSLSWLANNGTAAIVCFPGIMYRGGAEQKIRKYLVDNNYVDAIIQLPSNLFLNVTISVDIMVLRKNKTDNGIMFVDASGEFVKVTKNNRLTEANIQRIVSAVAERKDVDHFCRLVPNDEVGSKENAYNLSVSTYVEAEDTREKVDIVKLNIQIAEIVAREAVLRAEIDKIIAEIEVGQ